MKFRSVLGKSPNVGFAEAMFNGLAPDGGLYVPEDFPSLPSQFLSQSGHTLHSIGAEFLAQFIDEIAPSEILGIVQNAWQFPIPLVKLDDGLYLLELFHGPTLAFKDVGAKFMAGIMSHILRKQHREVAILVATSGDTGGAVANGFYRVPNVSVYVLFPSRQVSPLQERQMTTLGENIHAIEVEGTFDDCQKLVKQAFADPELSSRRALTTANSINVARLLPQAAYYGWGVEQLSHLHGEKISDPLVVVPSGNFGNLTAAVYAKAAGFSLGSFIAATNANDVVPAFLRSGEFHPRSSMRTYSNAMDVGDPSNLARLRAYYRNVDAMRARITGVSITDDETLEEISRTYRQYGYIADPHTAVGLAALRAVRKEIGDTHPAIVVATAHPAKFREVIKKALTIEIPLPDTLSSVLEKPVRSTMISAHVNPFKKLLLE